MGTAAASAQGEILVQVEKPLGVTLGKGPGGNGVVVTGVRGNAADAGLKKGDNVIFTSSFFGDELWPADSLAFVRSAINATPNQVDFIVQRGQLTADVKKLAKRPAPQRFGRKLSAKQKERATHICLDCGYVYTAAAPFKELPADYKCPQCAAPKARFAEYDVETGKAKGGGTPLIVTVAGLVAAA